MYNTAYGTICTIANAAQQLGVTLPRGLDDTLKHAETLNSIQPTADLHMLAEAAIREHLGNPDAYAKARYKGIALIATEKARAEFDATASSHADIVAHERLQALGEEVAAAFNKALAKDFAAIEHAGKLLPETITRSKLADLNSDQFAAYKSAEAPLERVNVAHEALKKLSYLPGGYDQRDLPGVAAWALVLWDPSQGAAINTNLIIALEGKAELHGGRYNAVSVEHVDRETWPRLVQHGWRPKLVAQQGHHERIAAVDQKLRERALGVQPR